MSDYGPTHNAEASKPLADWRDAKIKELREALACEMDDTRNGIATLSGEVERLAARLTEAEREADLYHTAMEALRSTKMKHGLCQPRERMACTHCNAVDKLDAMLIAYKGRRIVASFAGAAVSADGAPR